MIDTYEVTYITKSNERKTACLNVYENERLLNVLRAYDPAAKKIVFWECLSI